jgi:hypothetical protein
MSNQRTNKFCSSCGAELKAENAVICVTCGAGQQKQATPWSSGTKATLYILAIFFPIIGLIAGIVGLFNENNRGTGLALIVLSGFCWVLWTAVFLGAAFI